MWGGAHTYATRGSPCMHGPDGSEGRGEGDYPGQVWRSSCKWGEGTTQGRCGGRACVWGGRGGDTHDLFTATYLPVHSSSPPPPQPCFLSTHLALRPHSHASRPLTTPTCTCLSKLFASWPLTEPSSPPRPPPACRLFASWPLTPLRCRWWPRQPRQPSCPSFRQRQSKGRAGDAGWEADRLAGQVVAAMLSPWL